MFKIIEAYKDDVAVENEEEAVDMDMDEVGDSMMTVTRTSKNEKAQQEVMGEANVKCYNYKNFGHYVSECRAPSNKRVE